MKKSVYELHGKDKVEEVVLKSKFMSDVLRFFGRSTKGTGNFSTLKNYLDSHSIDYSHFDKNRRIYQRETLKKIRELRTKSFEEILVEKSSYSRTSLKKRLLDGNILKNMCSICGIGQMWNNQVLNLQLDHINGVFNDNRLDNLRILCPNCHSQLPTTSGKHKRQINKKRFCVSCGTKILHDNKSGYCMKCRSKTEDYHIQKKNEGLKNRKVDRPSKEELQKMIWERPTSCIAKDFGLSDKAIEKWCKGYGIGKPPRGYWGKIRSQNIIL